jgi:hypothetical protein
MEMGSNVCQKVTDGQGCSIYLPEACLFPATPASSACGLISPLLESKC